MNDNNLHSKSAERFGCFTLLVIHLAVFTAFALAIGLGKYALLGVLFPGYLFFLFPISLKLASRITAPSADQSRRRDKRPPILYLRSDHDDQGFLSDDLFLRLEATEHTFEQVV